MKAYIVKRAIRSTWVKSRKFRGGRIRGWRTVSKHPGATGAFEALAKLQAEKGWDTYGVFYGGKRRYGGRYW